MARYPRQPLETKLAWMRERQKAKEAKAALEAGTPPPKSGAPAVLQEPPVRRSPVVASPATGRKMYLRVGPVAEMLSVSTRTVQRWFADRAIIVRDGPSKTKMLMLIPQQALDDWLREHGPPSQD